MNSAEALQQLAERTAEAVAASLRTFAGVTVEAGEPEVVPFGTPPLDGVSVPAVAAQVSYQDGLRGGNVFVTTITGVRHLAAASLGVEADAGSQQLDEAERGAVAEAMAQMMAAAAAATGEVLGDTVRLTAPELLELETVADAWAVGEDAPYAVGVSFTLDGEPCRLVQLVPKPFILKMTRGHEDIQAVDLATGSEVLEPAEGGPDEILRGVPLRVCAEIGRASMPLAHAVALPEGGLVELDRGAEEPVDVLVNGRRFATGRLVLVEGEWAVRIEEVLLDTADLA